ncbi:MAG: Biofilm regulator BssS, partial [Mycobacterium sp.]|nr:Biofilm regulator BssS [Mycobacterium sp.]
DALGAMGPLASELAGQGGGGGFKDSDAHDHGKSDDFEDGSHGKGGGDGGKNSDATSGKDDTGGKGDKNAPTQPAGTTQPQPGTQPAPPAAVPASAGGDPSRVVQMPDGSPVTATTAQHAAAVRAVLNGSTVTDGWKQAHVELPPPGTPVTAPADPSHLVPGQIAQFKSRDPVMYMGNGKIWLDGQLQSQSALPTGDFLGWVDPPQLAGTTSAWPSPGTAGPTGQPTTTNTSGS